MHPPWTDNDCSSNPYPYLVYIVINILFNVCILMITKRSSALLGFMAIKAVLPISVLLFFINWYSPFRDPVVSGLTILF